ncbi:ATP-binding protein [Streptomyces sp. ISL-12]|nr:ATP-binding protein [Streptomyces sp. ISL-12]
MERQAHRGGPVAVGTRPVDEAAEENDDKAGGKNGGESGEQAGGKNGEQVGEKAGDAMDGASRIRCRLRRCDLGAVPEARRALRELLRHWGRPDRSEVAELLASELVTNALVHTDRDAVLTATVGPRALRVEVRDLVSRWPRPRAVDAGDSTSGRGLLLVQSLADAWGVRAHAVGKSVWFELDAGPA